MPPPRKGLLSLPPASAFRQDVPAWMRMDPRQAQAAQTQQFLGDRQAEREQKNFDTTGLGDISTGANVAGGLLQYLAGEAMGAMGVDPVGLLMRGADALGVDPMYGLAAGAGLLGMKKFRGASKEILGNPKVKKTLSTLDRIPDGIRQTLPHMSPLEQEKVLASPDVVSATQRLLEVLPTAERMAATMKAGEAKRGWYEASSRAIHEVFGLDAPRFASLLAATSPQTSVESNLLNSLNIWTNWDKAGRPTDRESILAIMGRSVQGNKGEDSVLDAWKNNTIAALSAPPGAKITLSGPKVNSFALNLQHDVNRVTLDAWMANGMGLSQDIFSGSPTELQLAKGDPGITPRYAAVSGRVRQASKSIGYTPAEGQETFWSVVMPMYEEAKRRGISAQELLQKGYLTNGMVRGTPDFSTIFRQDPKARGILERGGYGDRIAAMTEHKWPDINLNSAPDLSIQQQRHLEAVAKTLDETAGLRRNESIAVSVPGAKPSQVTAHSTWEYLPGANVGVGNKAGANPSILDEPYSKRKAYADEHAPAFTDLRGRDTILESVFPGQTTTTRPTQGAFLGPNGMEYQPGNAAGVNLPLEWKNGRPQLRPADSKAFQAAERGRGLLMQQHGIGYNAVVPDPNGTSVFTTRPKRATEAQLQGAAQLDPKSAYADTGRGVASLDIGDGSTPVTAAKLSDLTRIFDEPLRPGKKGNPSTSYQGTNVGGYVDNKSGYLDNPMGSGKLTGQFLGEFDQLTAARKKALSASLQKSSSYLKSLSPRPGSEVRTDTENLRGLLSEGGVEALRQGWKKGVALPVGLLGVSLWRGRGEDEQR